MGQSMLDAYLAEVQALWPAGPPQLSSGRGAARDARGGLLVLPHARAPRLLVPADHAAAASRAMLRFSAGLEVPDTAKRAAVAAALRLGLTSRFPDRILPGPDAGSLREHLSEVLGRRVEVSLGIGTARANRKPVLQIFDARGRSVGYAKVGSTPLAETHVAGEAEALQRIAAGGLPARLEVPPVLYVGRYRDMFVLVMGALDTVPWQRPSRQWDLPVDDMRAVALTFDEGDAPLPRTALWRRLTAARDGCSDSEVRERYAGLLERLAGAAGDLELRIGAWHGDWTPWNMSRRRGGRLQLWDWERFETGVPVGLDAFHYGVNAVIRRDGLSPGAVRAGLRLAEAQLDADPDTARVLADAYLAAIAARYLAQAETDLGETVQQRLDVVLGVLGDRLDVRTDIKGETR